MTDGEGDDDEDNKLACVKCTSGNGPSERNPIRTKANFVLLGNGISFLWEIVLIGIPSDGILFWN